MCESLFTKLYFDLIHLIRTLLLLLHMMEKCCCEMLGSLYTADAAPET